jgi:hypothetical protein
MTKGGDQSLVTRAGVRQFEKKDSYQGIDSAVPPERKKSQRL